MSTKIFDAYIWSGTAPELMDFLKKLRKKYIEVATNHLVKAQRWFEEAEKEYKEEGKHFSMGSYLMEQIRKGINNPDNIESSSAVYFRGDVIAVQFFGFQTFWDKETRPLQEFIKNHPKLSEYEYWNNVDQPEDITDDKWDERKKFWDFLNVPNEDGLIYEFSTFHTVYEIARNYYEKTR